MNEIKTLELFYLKMEDLKIYIIAKDKNGKKVRTNCYGNFEGTLKVECNTKADMNKSSWLGKKAYVEGEMTNIKIGRKRRIKND